MSIASELTKARIQKRTDPKDNLSVSGQPVRFPDRRPRPDWSSPESDPVGDVQAVIESAARYMPRDEIRRIRTLEQIETDARVSALVPGINAGIRMLFYRYGMFRGVA